MPEPTPIRIASFPRHPRFNLDGHPQIASPPCHTKLVIYGQWLLLQLACFHPCHFHVVLSQIYRLTGALGVIVVDSGLEDVELSLQPLNLSLQPLKPRRSGEGRAHVRAALYASAVPTSWAVATGLRWANTDTCKEAYYHASSGLVQPHGFCGTKGKFICHILQNRRWLCLPFCYLSNFEFYRTIIRYSSP